MKRKEVLKKRERERTQDLETGKKADTTDQNGVTGEEKASGSQKERPLALPGIN